MMKTLPAFLGTSLALITTGLAAQGVKAADSSALKQAVPLVQILEKDTFSLVPQTSKAIETLGSVLLPATDLVAHGWGDSSHNHYKNAKQPSHHYPMPSQHPQNTPPQQHQQRTYPQTIRCRQTSTANVHTPHGLQSSTQTVVTDRSVHSDRQYNHTVKRCTENGGKAFLLH